MHEPTADELRELEALGELEDQVEEMMQTIDLQIPPRVDCALRFVEFTQSVMSMSDERWKNVIGEGRSESTVSPHPSQEGAFRLACGLLGDYFAGANDGYSRLIIGRKKVASPTKELEQANPV
jgi:hypothetical protein